MFRSVTVVTDSSRSFGSTLHSMGWEEDFRGGFRNLGEKDGGVYIKYDLCMVVRRGKVEV